GDGVIPGADCRVAVPPGADGGDLAKAARLYDLLRLFVNQGADALAADLNNALRLFRCGDDLRALRMGMDHGLFAVDVLARIQGVNGCLFVPVVRSSYQDGVHVRTGENLIVIARGENRVSPQLLAARKAAIVTIRHCHQFHPRHLESRRSVSHSLAARAYESKMNLIVRRMRRRWLLLGLREQMRLKAIHNKTSGGRHTPRLQKVSAIETISHSSPPPYHSQRWIKQMRIPLLGLNVL